MPEVPIPAPSPALPLQGITILAVEDSRYACEALRLIAQRLGARLRRAETLAEARRHLALYRPDVVLVDLGLPDGNGAALIADLARRGGGPAVLAMSGDAAGRPLALGAGAAGFLEKPVGGIAVLRDAILRHLGQPAAADPPDAALPAADPLALRDDLERAARLLDRGPDEGGRHYLARFIAGIARCARDDALAEAAGRMTTDATASGAVAALVARRLRAAPGAFVRGVGRA